MNIYIHRVEGSITEIVNWEVSDKNTIHLSFHLNEHYNSIRIIGENESQEKLHIPLCLLQGKERLGHVLEQVDL